MVSIPYSQMFSHYIVPTITQGIILAGNKTNSTQQFNAGNRTDIAFPPTYVFESVHEKFAILDDLNKPANSHNLITKACVACTYNRGCSVGLH